MAGIPIIGVALGALAAAAAVAFGKSQLSAIDAQQFEGGGGLSGGSPSVPSAPAGGGPSGSQNINGFDTDAQFSGQAINVTIDGTSFKDMTPSEMDDFQETLAENIANGGKAA